MLKICISLTVANYYHVVYMLFELVICKVLHCMWQTCCGFSVIPLSGSHLWVTNMDAASVKVVLTIVLGLEKWKILLTDSRINRLGRDGWCRLMIHVVSKWTTVCESALLICLSFSFQHKDIRGNSTDLLSQSSAVIPAISQCFPKWQNPHVCKRAHWIILSKQFSINKAPYFSTSSATYDFISVCSTLPFWTWTRIRQRRYLAYLMVMGVRTRVLICSLCIRCRIYDLRRRFEGYLKTHSALLRHFSVLSDVVLCHLIHSIIFVI